MITSLQLRRNLTNIVIKYIVMHYSKIIILNFRIISQMPFRILWKVLYLDKVKQFSRKSKSWIVTTSFVSRLPGEIDSSGQRGK